MRDEEQEETECVNDIHNDSLNEAVQNKDLNLDETKAKGFLEMPKDGYSTIK